METNLRRHVYPHFGNRRLASIRPSEVQGVAKLNTRLSPSTGQVIHGILAAIYKAAIRDRRVNASGLTLDRIDFFRRTVRVDRILGRVPPACPDEGSA